MKLNRRKFLKAAGAASVFSLSCGIGDEEKQAGKRQRSGRPNILYILTDQWRAQALSCAGDKNIQTTNIDLLAKEGLFFARSYSNSPVCTPHRSMLMSGRYPSHTQVWQNNTLLSPDETCIAETFSDAGYNTGYIGKWHLDGPARPGNVRYRQGWQYWAGFNRGHNFNKGVYFTDSDKPISVPEGVFEPVHQTGLAIGFIKEKTASQKPWFLMVSFGGPHMPYTAPKKYMDMFNPEKFILRPNVKQMNAQQRKALHGYYAHCKCLDDNIGRIVAALKECGADENTLICFTSDHGDMHSSQGQSYKSKPWEESIGVPFIAKWPKGIPAGQTTDALFSTIDIYPTLCGLAGIPVPDGKDGLDCSGIVKGNDGKSAEAVFLMIGEPDSKNAWRGIRTERHTYACYPNQRAGYVLYDNRHDPYQLNNLLGKSEHKVLAAKMHKMLTDWMVRAGEPLAAKMDFTADKPAASEDNESAE